MKDTEDSIGPEQQAIVDKAVSALAEHFDTVRIFVTKYDGAQACTDIYDSGSGNFYAQLGQIYDWLNIQRADAKNIAVQFEDGDDDDGDV